MVETQIDLSLIIPFFNGEAFLPRLLQSVSKAFTHTQSQINIELIVVVDSVETDTGAVELLLHKHCTDSLNSRIIRNERNLGVALSRNRGIQAASGRYITCIDQDDEVTEAYAAALLPFIRSDYDFILCNGTFLFDGSGISTAAYHFTPSINLKNIARFDIIRSPGQVVLKSTLLAEAGFPVPKNFFGADDKFCWVQLFLQHQLKVGYVKTKVYIGHFHKTNYSKDVNALYLCGLELWEHIKERNGREYNANYRTIRKNISFYYYQLNAYRSPKQRLDGFIENLRYHLRFNRFIGFLSKAIQRQISFK